MKTVKFYNTEQSVDIEDIADIESNFRLQFPRVYVTHLLLHNGGQCDPNVFSFIENGKETKSCVDWFLALYDGEYDNLEKYFELYKTSNRLPESVFPFAHDPGGNLLCLCCESEKVFFWDHESELETPQVKDLIYVSEGLTEFLSSLTSD